jgi:hypothetical protein
MIDVVTNSLESGDWIVVRHEGQTLHSGHRISAMDLVSIFEQLGLDADYIAVTDDDMEEMGF